MNKSIFNFLMIICLWSFSIEDSFAGKVEWDFSLPTTTNGEIPVRPSVVTLAGTVEDWTFDGNPDNYANSFLAATVSDGFLHFLDDASIAGNLSLLTSDHFEVRDDYMLEGPGDRLWIICDHQMLSYGQRANLEPGSVDQTRGQVFWVSFLTSNFSERGIQFVANNYNTEGQLYFTAIGSSAENQDRYLEDDRLLEDLGGTPNLDRRTVTIRLTENEDPFTVTVDVKFNNDAYRTIDAEYEGPITNYPAGNGAGDEFILAVIGNNSGSGAVEFNMYRLTITDEDPDEGGTEVRSWSLF